MQRRRRTQLILATVFVMFLLPTYAQKSDFINFVPVSPNAAALGKFGNIPVSYYTGTPSIEVPLYTIEDNGLKVPIKLSYHAGGIKVSELASWVGLGWAMNAGGAVIRNERGLADDLDAGYLHHGKAIDQANLNIGDYYDAAKGSLDLEADEYLFNFPGGSGKFILDQEANAILVPHQQAKVYALDVNGTVFNSSTQGSIMGWKIVGIDGVQYYFKAIEETRQIDQPSNNRHTTAWNLTMIVSTDKVDTINFEYQDAGFTTHMPISQTRHVFIENDVVAGDQIANCIVSDPSASSTYSQLTAISSKRLFKIHFSNGYIQFFPSTIDRCELPGEEFLDRIVVFNESNMPIKEIQLGYHYLYRSSILPFEQTPCPSDDVRLMLTSVTETGHAPYRFEYIHDKGLPNRFSAAQDHWGFYNREHSSQLSLLPGDDQTAPLWLDIANEREANIDYGKQGSLKKIKYPTGGTTEFEYDPHTAVLSTLDNFPELVEGYNIQTIPARTINVDYGYHNYQVATFDVNYLETGLVVSLMTDNFQEASGSYFKIINSQNEEMPYELSRQEGSKRYYGCTLPNGSYRIIALRIQGRHEPIGQSYPLTIQEYNSVTANSPSSLITIGGLRIKQMTDKDPVTGKTQIRAFEYGPGALIWGLKYSSERKQYRCTVMGDNGSLDAYVIGKYLVFGSSSNYPLSNTQGSPVGYSSVVMTEYYIKPNGSREENGRTIFEYTSGFEYEDEGFASYRTQGHSISDPPSSTSPTLYSDNTSSLLNYQFPYAPPRNNDWKRGLLKTTTIQKKNKDGTYETVSFERNHYVVAAINGSIRSVRCGIIFDASIPTSEVSEVRPLNAPMDEVAFSYYDSKREYIYLSNTDKYVYDNLGNGILVTTQYSYDNAEHLLPNRTVITASDGTQIHSVTSYPQDYAAGTGFIDALVAANNISAPIENVTYEKNADGIVKITSGSVNTYLGDGKGLIDQVKILEVPDDVMLSAFKFSNRLTGVIPTPETQKSAFALDHRYVMRLSFPKYSFGKVQEQQRNNDVLHSYIWDHDHQYLIAHVINAASQNVAFTGFEADGNGSWTLQGGTKNSADAIAGRNSYSISSGNSIQKTGLVQGDYIVSYWSKTGSLLVNGTASSASMQRDGWTLFEHKLLNISTVSIAGTGTIDELRLLPADAQMTTYSYLPLVGLESTSDANNKIMYYEYDTAGRLVVVRDENKGVVKKYKYNYMR